MKFSIISVISGVSGDSGKSTWLDPTADVDILFLFFSIFFLEV